jgi:hypothetical protein
MALVNKRERRQRIQTIKEDLIALKVQEVSQWGFFTDEDEANRCFFCFSPNHFNAIFHLHLNTGRKRGFLVCQECTHALNKLDWNMLIRRKGVTL